MGRLKEIVAVTTKIVSKTDSMMRISLEHMIEIILCTTTTVFYLKVAFSSKLLFFNTQIEATGDHCKEKIRVVLFSEQGWKVRRVF